MSDEVVTDKWPELSDDYWVCSNCGNKESVRGATLAIGPVHRCVENCT